MTAHALVHSGLDVLMIERGVPVERGEHNWARDQVLELSPYYTQESHYQVRGDDRGRSGTFQCVGGPAVFYGGVALRLREADFG
jgi:choline dehydrogenase-like flavoprotein